MLLDGMPPGLAPYGVSVSNDIKSFFTTVISTPPPARPGGF
nr:MAG TPA: hypothetical protein [Caudoviricetes sp.]